MVSLDGQQACIFALRACVGLEGNRVIPGTGDQHLFKFTKQLLIAPGLVQWRKRVDIAEFRPGDGYHFRGRIQFHRA